MDDTLKVRARGHLSRSSFIRPDSAQPPRVAPRNLPWMPVRDCRKPFLALESPGSVCSLFRDGTFPAVAYFWKNPSRLGHSPNGVFDRAHHNTTRKCKRKTNNRLDKIFHGLPADGWGPPPCPALGHSHGELCPARDVPRPRNTNPFLFGLFIHSHSIKKD